MTVAHFDWGIIDCDHHPLESFVALFLRVQLLASTLPSRAICDMHSVRTLLRYDSLQRGIDTSSYGMDLCYQQAFRYMPAASRQPINQRGDLGKSVEGG